MNNKPRWLSLAILVPVLSGTSCGPGEVYVDRATGVTITFEIAEDTFPTQWQKAPISMSGVPLASERRSRCQDIILQELAKYPEGFLRGKLSKVHVFAALMLYGGESGGTSSALLRAIYLSYRDWYPPGFLNRSFHHELSSLLIVEYPPRVFAGTSWAYLLNPAFESDEGSTEAIQSGRNSIQFTEAAHKKGYLHEYAMASAEEDFNSFAENLFAPSVGFWEAIDKYPRLKDKMRLTVRYYQSLDRRLNETFFRGQKSL